MVPCHAALNCMSLSAALGSSDFLERHWKLGSAHWKLVLHKNKGKVGCSDCKVLVGAKKAVQKMG